VGWWGGGGGWNRQQDRGLVPVDVLGAYLTALERDDADMGDDEPAPRRRDPWREPVHLNRVGETDDELVDYAVLPNTAGQELEFESGGICGMKISR
jgi:hypothetical protein